MEYKTSKLLKSTYNREWNGPRGLIYYFDLEWENGDKGQISTIRIKERNGVRMQEKFIVGNTYEYSAETKVNKTTNDEYLFFDNTKKPPAFNSRPQHMEDPGTQARIIRSVSLEAALKFKKLTGYESSVFELSNFFVNWIDSKGENEKGRLIAAQAALNRAILSLELSAEESRSKYADTTKFMNVCQYFFDYIYKQDE